MIKRCIFILNPLKIGGQTVDILNQTAIGNLASDFAGRIGQSDTASLMA